MPSPQRLPQVQLVGRKIRKLRKERKLTQTELSSRIGIQQSDLSRMEQGQYRVSLDTLFRILAEFNLSIGEFFEEAGRPAVEHESALVRDFRSLPAEAQREVHEFVRFKRLQRSEEPEPE
jgi:transcriptional regulator with XRE-family HTH domain